MTRGRLIKGVVALSLLGHNPALTQTVDDTRSLLLNPLRAIQRSSLSGFRDKPLFTPARAEPAAPVMAPVAIVPPPKVEMPPSPPPRLVLIGIVNSGQDVAIVHENDAPAAKMLESGDRLGAWLVTILPPRTLRLTDGARTVDYKLFAHEPAAPAGAAVVRPPP